MRVYPPSPPFAAGLNCRISFTRRDIDTDISSTVVLESKAARRAPVIETTPQALHNEADAPVGLSDPQYVGQKRKMLDSVNRLRATG